MKKKVNTNQIEMIHFFFLMITFMGKKEMVSDLFQQQPPFSGF